MAEGASRGRCTVVVGGQWGDEGKGKVVDVLAEGANIIARYQGGANAGHTVHVGDEEFILHQIPSGILHPEKRCLLGNGVVLDPLQFFKEYDGVEARGRSLEGRVGVSLRAQLLLPYHRLLDQVHEGKTAKKIGTTGRGIGPAYEDKVSRRAVRVSDLFVRENFAAKLGEILDYHNFLLKNYFKTDTVDFAKTLDEALEYAEIIAPITTDITQVLHDLAAAGNSILFEGAQGSFLDIDHGTYPFVTSSNTVAAAACTGTGVGPRNIDYVLGIVKAYTTRVGAGPFPTELFDEQGEHIARVGAEFGATTGRPRRCGWFDAVALRRSIINSSVSGLCVTKLDVLDELETIQICVGYEIDGQPIAGLPVLVDRFAECEPVYEEWPGWQQSTFGLTHYEELPEKARAYLARIEELAGVPVDIISTGPGREQTIIKSHPFE